MALVGLNDKYYQSVMWTKNVKNGTYSVGIKRFYTLGVILDFPITKFIAGK